MKKISLILSILLFNSTLFAEDLYLLAKTAETHAVNFSNAVYQGAADGKCIGNWQPSQMSQQFKTLEWDVTEFIKTSGEFSFIFQYKKGQHRLDIAWASLLENGKELSRDTHSGITGGVHKENTYTVELNSFEKNSKYLLKASVKSDGGTDSYGSIFIVRSETFSGYSPDGFKYIEKPNTSCLIGKNIAMFLPAGTKQGDVQYSPALVNRPVKKADLPSSWKLQPVFSVDGKRYRATLKLDKNISLYGGGEVTGSLLRNGTEITLWNTDNFRYNKYDGGRRLYQSHPWIIGVRDDGSAFGVLFDTTWKATLNLEKNIQFTSEGPAFPVYIVDRDSPQDVVRGLAEFTGKMEMPPLWALGFQQCRWSYCPDSRVRQIADEFRNRKIPCDVIWIDIDYMEGFRVFTFSKRHFPEPKETNKYLHGKGFKSVWMIDPGVKKDDNYWVYKSGCENDVWVKTADGKTFIGNVWPGPCAFPDYTRPETRKWWAGLYKEFMSHGIDGVWNDMNEPAVFSGPMPIDNIHRGGGEIKKGSHLQYRNIYGMLMSKATREGILKANPDKRPFVLTRSTFIGGHRYAATWTGDNISHISHLKMSIPMSITLGLSGQPFSGPDIGGFSDNVTADLFADWIAVGAFYPFSRAHSEKGRNNKEPWAFGDQVEKVSRTALERRYRLLPYIYTLFYEASKTGMPVMRPAFFADPKDQNLRDEEQIFLLGSDLLIIPKWARNVTLPKGIWRTFSLLEGDAESDNYQPELKIRGGSIIPLGKIIQNTTEYSLDPLTLLVCLDENGKAEGVLYEDEGNGFAYKKGEYLLTKYVARESGNNVIVEIESCEGKMKRPQRRVKIKIITDSGIIDAEGLSS